MGRIISGAAGAASIGSGGGTSSTGGTFRLKAGVATAINDLMLVGPDGRAYPGENTESSTAANAAAVIIAETQLVASQPQAYNRMPVCVGPDGSIYTARDVSAIIGLIVDKFSPAGALLATVTLNAPNLMGSHRLFLLSNGNLAVCVINSSGLAASYAVMDPNLNVVTALTALAPAALDYTLDAFPLTGGGFAMVWRSTGAITFTVRDNAGASVVAPTTILALVGGTGVCIPKIAQLSNGNLAIAVSCRYATTKGLYRGVYTVAGAAVMAMANTGISPGNTASQQSIDLSVMVGYFAIAHADPDSAVHRAVVCDNTGAIQGAAFSQATTTSPNYCGIKLANDGVAFYMMYSASPITTNWAVITKIPVTGTNYATYESKVTGSYNDEFDFFCERGRIAGVAFTAGGFRYFCIRTDNYYLEKTGTFGSGGIGQYGKVLPFGDFSFLGYFDGPDPASKLYAAKYQDSSIAGVATSAAVADAYVNVQPLAGAYTINTLKGRAVKTFAHTASNIPGNQGTVLNNAVILKGY